MNIYKSPYWLLPSEHYLGDEKHGINLSFLITLGDPLSKAYTLKKFVDQVFIYYV